MPPKTPPPEHLVGAAPAAVSVWDGAAMPPAAPQPAAPQQPACADDEGDFSVVEPALEKLAASDAAIIGAALEKMKAAGFDLPQDFKAYRLTYKTEHKSTKVKGAGGMRIVYCVPLGWKAKPEALQPCDWPYTYVGYHGTPLWNLSQIMAQREVKAFEKGSRAIFLRAGMNPTESEQLALLLKVLLGTKGQEGVAIEMSCERKDMHRSVKSGGVPEEVAWSRRGFVTSFKSRGEGTRWTFPDGAFSCTKLWLDCTTIAHIDVCRLVQSATLMHE
jgi:hypothetical protein